MSILGDLIEMIEENAPKSAGRTALLKHLNGERLTQRQAIVAKCTDCMGYWIDGRQDCGQKTCSLYPFRPYKDKPRQEE
jgi:hypothetical protein